jgi:two-component system sensor histidine kinase/response regulator
VDTGRESPSSSGLLNAIRARADSKERMVLVTLGRDRRQYPRAEADGCIVIDGNALSRRTLVNAVAMAAGRASSESDYGTAKPKPVKTPAPPREEAIRRGQLILVAEDNEINQKVIRQQLAQLGYTADLADNGKDALNCWRRGDYALLFTDLHMPEMDGYALALAIRSSEGNSAHIPIIALTANALKGEADRCRSVGMDEYLSKPAVLSELDAVLSNWLPAQSEAEHASQPPVDVATLESFVGKDPQVVRGFLLDFRVSTERMAAELDAAFASGRNQDVCAVAHKLKSSASAVGAKKLSDICATIEALKVTGDFTTLPEHHSRFQAEAAAVDHYLESLPLVAEASAGVGAAG